MPGTAARHWQGKTVAIQGFGNVGSHTADILHDMGMRVVAVSDVKGGIYHRVGLPIDKVLSASQANADRSSGSAARTDQQ